MSLAFRRHYKLIVLLVLVAALLILALGDQRIVAYTVQHGEPVVERNSNDGNTVTLVDDTMTEGSRLLVSDVDSGR